MSYFKLALKTRSCFSTFTGDGTLSVWTTELTLKIRQDFLSYTRFGDSTVRPFSFSMHLGTPSLLHLDLPGQYGSEMALLAFRLVVSKWKPEQASKRYNLKDDVCNK